VGPEGSLPILKDLDSGLLLPDSSAISGTVPHGTAACKPAQPRWHIHPHPAASALLPASMHAQACTAKQQDLLAAWRPPLALRSQQCHSHAPPRLLSFLPVPAEYLEDKYRGAEGKRQLGKLADYPQP
jgi:hypothetical protein